MHKGVKKEYLFRYIYVGLQKETERRRPLVKRQLAILLAGIGILTAGISTPVSAEEYEPAGYHVYDVQEEEATDTWYGVARGDYLQAGIAKVKKGSSSGYAMASGSTLAHRACDHLYVRVYLDESENGTDGWWTLNYWKANAYNNSVVTVSSGDYKITKGDYYRTTGAHSVFQDDIVESTMTCTDAVPLK